MKGQIKLIFTILCISVLFIGCSESPVTPDGSKGNINGKILDKDGFPVSNAHINIQNKITTTNHDGIFSVEEITIPYDLKFLNVIDGKFHGSVFEELRTFNPVLTGKSYYLFKNYCDVNFTIPIQLSGNQIGVIIFTDNSNVFAHQIFSGNNTHNFRIEWSGRSTVPGKIYLLIYENVNYEYFRYDYFAEISYTIEALQIQNKTFTSSEIKEITGEETILAELEVPEGYFSNPNIGLFLRYGPGIGQRLNIGGLFSISNSYTTKIATGLPSGLKFSIYTIASEQGFANGRKIIDLEPGISTYRIVIPPSPTLELPETGSTGIDSNTLFSFSHVSGVGVYKFTFWNNNKSFSVITSKNYSKFPNFDWFGQMMGEEEQYYWHVEKFNIPIDEFVSTRPELNQRLTTITMSRQRGFVTE